MFKVKFLLVLALLALVVEDEVKCTGMDEVVAVLIKLSSDIIKNSAAFDENEEKREAIKSGTYTENSAAFDENEEKMEAIKSGTYTENSAAFDENEEKREAIKSGTYTENGAASDENKEKEEKEEAIKTGTLTEGIESEEEQMREAMLSGTFTDREEAIYSGTFKGSTGPTNKPVLPVKPSVKPIKAKAYSSSDGDINAPICGTRSNRLSHSILNTQRIVGGSVAKPGDWPWQVGLSYSTGLVFCGGTLVTNEWIVTAAHCVTIGSNYWINLGDHDKLTDEGTEQRILSKEVIPHPSYISATKGYDVALIKLSRPVAFTKFIRPACIPKVSPNSGTKAYVSGWGHTSEGGQLSRHLKVAEVPILSQDTCRNTYGYLGKTMICAGGKAEGGVDTCQGDSGGPLVVEVGGKYHVVGATSFGRGCARPHIPGVYARVTAFWKFINRHILGIIPTLPPTIYPALDLLTCNFHNDFCKWTQSTNDQFDWSRSNTATKTSGSGPSGPSMAEEGHGVSGDHYIFIETSYPRRAGDKATLTSPEINTATPTCLRFKYHMYGTDINTLKIEKVEGKKRTTLFTKTGNQGDKWLNSTVDLSKGGPYKIEITANRGQSYRGDIAMDQFRHTPNSCDWIPTGPTLPPVSDYLNCNFEKDICQWTQSQSDKFDWGRMKGSTPSFNTGPTQSSTGAEGWYLYIEASYPRRNGDYATLTSPDIRSSSAACLKFKAHMYGKYPNYMAGSLEIVKLEGNTRTKIFSKKGSQGNNWISYNADLSKGGPYKLEIIATRRLSYMEDIAIDDLHVTPKPCASTR